MCSLVFFQAEDGIRDLVRSRGLGDVYKRQAQGQQIIGANHAFQPHLRDRVAKPGLLHQPLTHLSLIHI